MVQYALNKMGIVESSLDILKCFIGPPLQVSFTEYYHFNEANTQKAIQLYRERFKEKGMYENTLYPDTAGLLQLLKEQGFILTVATSKPTVFAEQILEYFQINKYFEIIAGSNLDGTRSAKAEIIRYIIDNYPEYKLEEFIMVGDRKHDIIGANQTGIDSIGVTYGYGSLGEVNGEKPTFVVDSLKQVNMILNGESLFRK
nr:HAD hydrolase-like protein [Oceanobacillus jeddahense]